MLFLHKNIYVCCYSSSELSRRDGSDEGSQHMVSMRNIKNYSLIIIKYSLLSRALGVCPTDISCTDDHLFLIHFRFLGYVDKIGVAYEAPSVASGYGAYIAQVSFEAKRLSSH